MCSRRGKKRLNEELEIGDISRRRRRTPGFTPFKQVEIPASWKFEPQKLREAVRTSVAHCHYDDPSKRERLGNAVFEALSGQKTMKAAATMHGVPFTTLQTYFHRSRARMAKMMSDNDNALSEQIQIPVSLNLSSSCTDNALEDKRIPPIESKKSGRLDSLIGVLAGKVMAEDSSDNASSPSSDVAARTGSNKRKPKEVRRIAPPSPLKDETVEDDIGSADWFSDQSRDMRSLLKLDAGLVQSCVDHFEQPLKCADRSLHKNKGDVEKTTENRNQSVGLLFGAECSDCLDAIDKCVNEVCRVSHYPASQKEALRKAVTMVILGEYSVSGAASIMQLPTSTLHPYVHRTRAALEAFLPRTTEADSETTPAEIANHSNSISKDMEKVVSDLMKISSYDQAGRQKLHDALYEVLTKDALVAEISSKHGIPVSAVQPYITKARLLLGQSPYPTTSGIQGPAMTADIKAANDSNKYTADEITENNFSKILNAKPSGPGSFPAVDTNFATVVVPTDVAKQQVKRGRRCSTGSVSNEVGMKKKSTDNSKDLLGGMAGNNGNRSDEFDDANHMQPDDTKNRLGGGNSETVTYLSQTEPSVNNTAVSNAKLESGDSDDEFDGLPRSIRGVAKLLSDTKLDRVSTKDYPGTPESLAKKIDKVLRQYRFRGDREKMRDAILEVLYESKTLSEACKGNSLAPTTLSTYVRLVKALINTDRAGAKGVFYSSSPITTNSFKKENAVTSNLSIKSELRNSILTEVSSETDAEITSVAISPSSSKVEPAEAEVGSGQNSNTPPASIELLAGTSSEHLIKEGAKRAFTINSSHAHGTNNLKLLGSSLIMNSGARKNAETGVGVKIGVNVMTLHSKSIMSNLESFYKLLITYLVEQQYRRSEEAQEKMRASLEYVLLDGLSVGEALRVHRGPTEHVLQVYLNRCREAYKCIKTEFANFKVSATQAISKNYASSGGPAKAVQALKNTAGTLKNSTMKRSSKRLQRKEDAETQANVLPTTGSLKHLNTVFCEDFQKPLYDYLKKLDDVNFPIEDCLIIGLAKMIVSEFPVKQKLIFADSIWDQWLANYRKEHPEFED